MSSAASSHFNAFQRVIFFSFPANFGLILFFVIINGIFELPVKVWTCQCSFKGVIVQIEQQQTVS